MRDGASVSAIVTPLRAPGAPILAWEASDVSRGGNELPSKQMKINCPEWANGKLSATSFNGIIMPPTTNEGYANRGPHALALVEYRMAKMWSSWTPSPLPHWTPRVCRPEAERYYREIGGVLE
jgi:hypothetical protein